jgi:hypothetical protein
MTELGAGRRDAACRQFEHAGGPSARQTDAPGFHVVHAVDDHPALVERDYVNGELHPECVHAAARHDPQRLSRLETFMLQQSGPARRARRSDSDLVRDHRVQVDVPGHQLLHRVRSTIGKRTVTNLMAAGPMVTTQIAGKMQMTSGNTILTPVFAAASSARCRRLVLSVSE